MDDERRQHEEARTFRAIAEMLDEPNRVDFPGLPVALDGAEAGWEMCGVALSSARNPLGHAPMMDKRLVSSPARARRFVEGQRAEFFRGGGPPPVSGGPSGLQRDRAALACVGAPLVLVAAAPAA